MTMRISIASLFLLACGNSSVPIDAGGGADAKSDSSLLVYHQKAQIVDSTTGAPIPYAYFGMGPFQGPTDATGSYDQIEVSSSGTVGPFSTYAAAPDGGTSYVGSVREFV